MVLFFSPNGAAVNSQGRQALDRKNEKRFEPQRGDNAVPACGDFTAAPLGLNIILFGVGSRG
jgi:hypothetical protein